MNNKTGQCTCSCTKTLDICNHTKAFKCVRPTHEACKHLQTPT